jgi:hypothetical protein
MGVTGQYFLNRMWCYRSVSQVLKSVTRLPLPGQSAAMGRQPVFFADLEQANKRVLDAMTRAISGLRDLEEWSPWIA